MNEILQKRIEEAAYQYIQSDAVTPENMLLAFGDFINGAKWALQNQWISVEEALPKKKSIVIVAILDTITNKYGYGFDSIDDNEEVLTDEHGFRIWNDTDRITHWMNIPKLKGGKE